MKLKTYHVPRGYDGVHLEVAGCAVNVLTGLTDTQGRSVVAITVRADRYSGEAPWGILTPHGELAEFCGVRVVRELEPETKGSEKQ